LDPSGPVEQDYWYYLLAPYLSASEYVQSGSESGAMKLMLCPMSKRVSSKDMGETRIKGAARLDWYDGYTYSLSGVPASGSYGMNCWLDYDYVERRSGYLSDPSENANGYRLLSEARGSVPLFGDSNWVGGWPDSIDPVPEDLEVGGLYPMTDESWRKHMGRFCIDRHNMKINLCFVDGSAESVNLRDLWKRRWHKNFTPREVDVPRK
jgi:prepilin-type processing-associated H-X9-DG protein